MTASGLRIGNEFGALPRFDTGRRFRSVDPDPDPDPEAK